jgi:hypothetical protein
MAFTGTRTFGSVAGTHAGYKPGQKAKSLRGRLEARVARSATSRSARLTRQQ